MNKIELFRAFQKNIMNLVQSEAFMCGFKEYSVSVRNHRTEVTIFVHRYSVTYTFYISGRVIVKTLDQKMHDETILCDEIDKEYISGRCTVADLAGKYVYDIFNEALRLRQQWRDELRERHEEKRSISEDIAFEIIEDQPHEILQIEGA